MSWVSGMVAVTLAGTSFAAQASDAHLLDVLRTKLPAAEEAAKVAAGGRGGPEAVQAEYDAARSLEQALRQAGSVSMGCRLLLNAASDYAWANIKEAEGIDRESISLAKAGARRATAAAETIRRTRASCRPQKAIPPRRLQALDQPLSYALLVSRIPVTARIPRGVDRAELILDGKLVKEITTRGAAYLSSALAAAPGRHTLIVRFLAGGSVRATAAAHDLWVLPEASPQFAEARSIDRTLNRELARATAAFMGYSAVWVHDLGSGQFGSVNADARFPAASMVKLGVLAAALQRYGPRPERSPAAYELQTMTAWSSNLASNRLIELLGGGSSERGAALVQAALRRAGATSSTFTGAYRVGTAAHMAAAEPPLVSSRVTTARDLGRLLYMFHAAAFGADWALRALQLSRHEAAIGLNLLLSSQSVGENRGLFRAAVGPTYPMAQKHGWISTARHSAAILYGKNGPKIVVALTYRAGGITRSEASRLAATVLRVAGA